MGTPKKVPLILGNPIFPTLFNGHDFFVPDYIRDSAKLQEDPYVHCSGSLNKATIDSRPKDTLKMQSPKS